MNDFEDRSRHSNLIFHGVANSRTVTWAQTQGKILEIICLSVESEIAPKFNERAHRLGTFPQENCRPIIVKFASYRLKDKILNSRVSLKTGGTTVNEDFRPTMQQARGQLYEFGVSQNVTFKLRYNKLFIGQACYTYDPLIDSVRQVVQRISSAPVTATTANRTIHVNPSTTAS